MWYAIMASDHPDSLSKRLSVREKHLERVQELVEQGRVLLAGPHPAIDAPESGDVGFTGSLIVAEFASQRAAEEWAAADPYVEAGVYADVVIKPFRKVLP